MPIITKRFEVDFKKDKQMNISVLIKYLNWPFYTTYQRKSWVITTGSDHIYEIDLLYCFSYIFTKKNKSRYKLQHDLLTKV